MNVDIVLQNMKNFVSSKSMNRDMISWLNISKNKRRIVFYCDEYGNAWWPKYFIVYYSFSYHNDENSWGPHSLSKGAIGGSEEAVINIAESLAKLGFTPRFDINFLLILLRYAVEIYADIIQSDRHKVFNGVLWMHYSEYNIKNYPDVFVSWRYAVSLSLCAEARICVLWLHDILPHSSLPKSILDFSPSNSSLNNKVKTNTFNFNS